MKKFLIVTHALLRCLVVGFLFVIKRIIKFLFLFVPIIGIIVFFVSLLWLIGKVLQKYPNFAEYIGLAVAFGFIGVSMLSIFFIFRLAIKKDKNETKRLQELIKEKEPKSESKAEELNIPLIQFED